MFTKLYAATWGDVGKAKEKGFFDFDLFSWMAWTWQTAAFFIFKRVTMIFCPCSNAIAAFLSFASIDPVVCLP